MKNKNTIIFDNYYMHTPGIWYFTPNDLEKYKKNKPCYGFGQIKYSEGSLYTGEIYYDGKKFHKQGFGQQDFTYSVLSTLIPETNDKIYLFIGQFDYKKTNWINGNGVLYYRDKDGNPTRFIKGFYTNLSKIGEYQGEFDYSSLINGYNKDMESNLFFELKLINKELDFLNDIKEYDTLFIGDSYFEFWYYNEYSGKHNFNTLFDTSKCLNISVGGTKFKDWIRFFNELEHLPKFKNIVVNLGFNDLHHSIDTNPETIYEDFLNFLDLYRTIFNESKFFILTGCHSEAYKFIYKNECKYNTLIKKYAKENNITIIDNCLAICKMQKLYNCFSNDDVHLNELGYEIMHKEIIKHLKKA